MKSYYKIFLYKYPRGDTIKSYQKSIRLLQRNCNVMYPNEISSLLLLDWRRTAVGSNIKPITWNSYLRHIKAIYKFGIEQNLLDYQDNPCNKLFLREGKAKRKILSSTELAKLDFFLQGAYNLPGILNPVWFVETLIKTFRYTAIRRAQLIKLKVGDIDLVSRIIHISPEINKNHHSHTIPISDKLFPYLQNLILELKRANQTNDCQLFNFNLFCPLSRNRAKNTSEHQISHIFKVISRSVGFNVSPHRFRHTVATNLMKNPNNLYVAKQLLGHRDIKVTLTYIEDDVEMIRDTVNSALL